MKSSEKSIHLKDLCLENKEIKLRLTEKEILEIFDLKFYLRYTRDQFISLGWKID